VKFQGNRGFNDDSMKETLFLLNLGQGHGSSYVMLVPLFNHSRELKVDRDLGFCTHTAPDFRGMGV
jgi:hypothetical protein